MGAWGSGIFDNDTACDFAADVAEGGDLALLGRAFDRVLAASDDYLEMPEAEEALAAADIVARLNGKPGVQSAYTETIDGWVGRQRLTPPDELVEKARRAIARILTRPSELLEEWEESDEFEAWSGAVRGISERL